MTKIARIGFAALVAVSIGCFSAGPVAPGSRTATEGLGSFAFSSAGLGHLTIAPSSCLSGGRQFFLGGDFMDDAGGTVVRLAVDPIDGPAVRVFRSDAPFENAAVFRRPECRVFHFSIDSTGWQINDVDDYKVTLDLDCTNSKGETLAGKASATHCH